MELENLDPETRKYMLAELDIDVKSNRLYLSSRFTPQGRADYEGLLREAISKHDPTWLASQLAIAGRMSPAEVSRSKKGKPYIKRTPWSDHMTAAFGEFNRFYIRGLCARAIAQGIPQVQVYRAIAVEHERSESQRLIGSLIDCEALLMDLRENVGRATRLGAPGGPNSGISVRLP